MRTGSHLPPEMHALATKPRQPCAPRTHTSYDALSAEHRFSPSSEHVSSQVGASVDPSSSLLGASPSACLRSGAGKVGRSSSVLLGGALLHATRNATSGIASERSPKRGRGAILDHEARHVPRRSAGKIMCLAEEGSQPIP